MSLYKQKCSDFWYVSITQPNGGRVRQSAGTTDKKEAQEYHDKLKHEMWRVSRMGDTPDYTWDKAMPAKEVAELCESVILKICS